MAYPPQPQPLPLPRRRGLSMVTTGVILICLGIIVPALGYGLTAWASDIGSRFDTGRTASIHLDSGRNAIWARTLPGTYVTNRSESPFVISTPCTVISPGGRKVGLSAPDGTINNSAGGATWELIWKLDAPTSGTYQVSCHNRDQLTLAVGKDTVYLQYTGFMVGLTALLFLPAGLVVTLIGAVRAASRRRA